MTAETREHRVALADRGVFSLPEAKDYAHLHLETARELCLVGVREMREDGHVTDGWECWTVGRGEWRVSKASIDRWIADQALRHALAEERHIGVRPPTRIGGGSGQ